MRAVLAGAVLTDMTRRDGVVVLGGALAAVVDGRFDEETARPASEGLGAPPLEQADAGGGQTRWAGFNTLRVQKVPTIATDLRRTWSVAVSAECG